MDLTTGNESRLIFRFAYPMLLGSIFQQLYLIVDSAVVGRYIGDAALGAVGASFPIIFALISFIIGVASGSTIIISQYFGARQIHNVQKTIETMFIFLFFAGIIITIAGWTLGPEIFDMIRLPEEIKPMAKQYLRIYLSGIILFFGYNGTSAVLRGLGDSMTPLVFLIISTIMNVLLDLLFVAKLGFGIEGAAYATIIAQGGAFFTAIVYLNKKHEIIQFRWNLTFDKEIFSKSIKIGLPSGIQQTMVSIGMIALFRIVNDFGSDVVAAYSVAGRIDAFAAMPAMTFAQALSTFVGQNLGANKPQRAEKAVWATGKINMGLLFIIACVLFFSSSFLVSVFNDNQEVIQVGSMCIKIVALGYVFYALGMVMTQAFNGAGDTVTPTLINALCFWAMEIPLAFYLALETSLDTKGVFLAITISESMMGLVATLWFMRGRWKLRTI